MKKRALTSVFLAVGIVMLIFFSLAFVHAADSEQASIDKAYQCLNNVLNNKTTVTLEQATFAKLAIGSKKIVDDEIKNEKSSSDDCWPKSGCRIKETAQMMLVYNRVGSDTSKIEKWLLSKNDSPSELVWYLQIDVENHAPASCEVKYGRRASVKIADDMKLSLVGSDDCLSSSSSGFWLKISPNCLNKEFEITCNGDFVTSLLYQKKTGDTVYVSSESHKSSVNGSTKEQVKAKCLKAGTACDYEGTLWAAFALNKARKDVSAFIPYLSALADDNSKYFPSAFLFTLTGSSANSEFYADIIQKQNRNDLWDITGSPYKKFFDTSLGLISLSGSKAPEFDRAKAALLELQNSDGCWSERDPIIDTAFILYSGWQRAVGGGGGGTSSTISCESVRGQFCENSQDCISVGGESLTNFECPGGNICCSKEVPQKSCASQKGDLCTVDEECNEMPVPSSDTTGTCCLGNCTKKTVVEYTCTKNGGSCKSSCADGEQTSEDTCPASGDVCCITKEVVSGTNWFLIILLIILIVLVILAIVFRDKLKIWWFRFRGKASVSPLIKPGVPPFSSRPEIDMSFKPSPRFAPNAQRPMPALQARRPVSPKDKEMEETLKKLKEMSK